MRWPAGLHGCVVAIVQSVQVVLAVMALSAFGVVAQDPGATPQKAVPSSTPENLSATPAPGSLSATPAAPIDTGDPRSDGQGPGIVGEPLFVLVGIVLIGAATVVVTAVVARATGRV